MELIKFEKAKEIEELRLYVYKILEYINKGEILISSSSFKMGNMGINIDSVKVPEAIANRIIDVLNDYSEELEKEFEKL